MKMFAFWRIALFLGWAHETGTWEITKEDTKRTLYFSILKVNRDGQNMYGMIIWAFAFYVAYVGEE